MKPFKNLSVALTTLALALPLALVSCGEDEKTDAADLATMTLMIPLLSGDAAAPAVDGEMQQAVEKLIGKKLKITWVPNAEYGDKTNVTLASDNIPDVMVVNEKSPAFVKAAEAGAFWDLTGKLDKYPNLKPANEQTAQELLDQRQGLRHLPGPPAAALRHRDPQGLAGQARPEGCRRRSTTSTRSPRRSPSRTRTATARRTPTA